MCGNYPQDTVSTLNFAKKGMKVVNKPFVTEVEEPKRRGMRLAILVYWRCLHPKSFSMCGYADAMPLKPATNLGLPERVVLKPALPLHVENRGSGGLSRPGHMDKKRY
jgi:hypothetical protein